MSKSALKNRNFLLHWGSGIISQMCGFFSFIALPWLVLSISDNNPFIMSTVLAASAFPQAFFMTFGGVYVDRFSPLKILLVSRLIFIIVMASLVLVVYFKFISIWMIYFYAFFLGTLSALMIPAGQALLPSILHKTDLGAANGITMASSQIAQILGTILAGWTIWYVKHLIGIEQNQSDQFVFAVAFSLDLFGAVVAFGMMCFIRIEKNMVSEENILSMLKQGFQFCWRDKGIATVLAYIMLISFFVQGVVIGGLPIFTKIHLGMGELAFSNLYTLMGVGVVIGVALGVLLKPTSEQMGLLVLICDLITGIGMFLLGNTINFFSAGACLLCMGACSGVVMVAGTTWFQSRTPDFLMGRVLSILMFSIIGLSSISTFFVGLLMLYMPVTEIICIAGVVIILIAVIGMSVPRIRRMGYIRPIYVQSDLASVTTN